MDYSKFYDNHFISDNTFWSTNIFDLIESKNYNEILNIITKKHKYEIEIDKNIQDKRNDLIITNAFLVRQVAKNKITQNSLHKIYNNFYFSIPKINTLKELQTLEIQIFKEYLTKIDYVTETENFKVNRMLSFINLHIESTFSLKDMAKYLNNSEPYLSTLFKKKLGVSIITYVHSVKIQRSKILLLDTSKSILEISELLGYYDTSHFSRKFKEIVGISPTKFRNTKC